MAAAALAKLKEAQLALIDALQQDYFCDDLEPPSSAFGWSFAEYEAVRI